MLSNAARKVIGGGGLARAGPDGLAVLGRAYALASQPLLGRRAPVRIAPRGVWAAAELNR